MTPEFYTADELALGGLSVELVLAIAFVDDGKGNVERAYLTDAGDATPLTGAGILGIVPPPASLCLVREKVKGADGTDELRTVGLGRIDADGNFNVREPWAAATREALAAHVELMRLRTLAE